MNLNKRSNEQVTQKVNKLYHDKPKAFIYGELAMVGLFFSSMLLKLSEINGVGIVLTISTGVLAIFYFFKAFSTFEVNDLKDSNEPIPVIRAYPMRLFANKLLYYSLSLISLGVLFTVMKFPGTTMMLILGGGTQVICLLIIGINVLSNPKSFAAYYWLRPIIGILLVAAFYQPLSF